MKILNIKYIPLLIIALFIAIDINSQTLDWSIEEKTIFKKELRGFLIQKDLFEHISIWDYKKISSLLLGVNFHYDFSYEEYERLDNEELKEKMIGYFDEHYDSFKRQFGRNFVVLDSIYREEYINTEYNCNKHSMNGYWESNDEDFNDLLVIDNHVWIHSGIYDYSEIAYRSELNKDTLTIFRDSTDVLRKYELVYLDEESIILEPIGRGIPVYANKVVSKRDTISAEKLIGTWQVDKQGGMKIVLKNDGTFYMLSRRGEHVEREGNWELEENILRLIGFRYREMEIIGLWKNELIVNSSKKRYNLTKLVKENN